MKPPCKATHYGTCQICGSRQLLPSGHLSKHGYTVRWGFFEGVCPGSGRLPFEQSTDAIADAIASVKRSITATNVEILTIEDLSNPVNDGSNVWVRIYATGRTGGYRWVKARLHDLVTDSTTYSRPLSKVSYTTHDKFFHHHARNEATQLTERVEAYDAAWEMHTMVEWARFLNRKYAQNVLAKANAERGSWLAWQQKRVSEWKPEPLTARK